MSECPKPEELRRLVAETRTGPDADTLAAHIENCPACQRLLDQLALSGPVMHDHTRTGNGSPAAVPDVPPDIPGYEVLEVLGRGGMGVVYRAVDRHLRREVALKVMLPQFATSPQARARFAREARAQAAVEHDHVTVIFQVGEHAGVPFLAMPLLKGMTLQAALRANPRPPLPEVLRIGREVAEGLAAAHEKGLVHRDIKTANIWLEGKKLRVKLLDFGLARAAADADAADQTEGPLTREGAVVGTPSYMSPEQANGLVVDARTDLWSLGVVLYLMTAGELPFAGATPVAVLRAIDADDPRPPGEQNPAVPPALGGLVMRLLTKDPAARPPTAEAVADELRAIEQELAGAVRVIPLDSPPIVLPATGPDPFAELDATEANTTEAEAPTGRARGRRGFPIWIPAVAAVLVAAALVGVVAGNRGAKVAPTGGTVPPDTKAPVAPAGKQPPAPAPDPTRSAAEVVLSLGGAVRVNGEDREIKSPADLPKDRFTLTGVNLDDSKLVTDAVLTNFKDCKDLADLRLSGTGVTDAGLANFSGCRNLVALDLSNTQIGDAGLAYFKDCKYLLHLKVQRTRVSAKSIEEFHATVPRCRIEHDGGILEFDDPDWRGAEYVLSIGGTVRVNGEYPVIKAAANLPAGHFTLTGVLLGSNKKVTDAGLANLKGCPNLVYLELNATAVGDAGVAHFKGCKSLTYLDLSDTRVTDTGLRNFEGCKGLVQLRLSGQGVTDAGVACFRGNKNLTALYLGATGVTEKGLANFKDCKGLTHLSLGGTPVTDAGIANFEGCKDLVQLTLGETGVTDEGLAHLKECKKLTLLYLSKTPVGNAGLAHFKDCKNLNSLYLDYTKVTDEGLAHFKECKNLTSLYLTGTGVSDEGLAHLKECKKLGSVSLFGTRVSDVGLGQLAECPDLGRLDVQGTQVTRDGVEAFRKVRPRCVLYTKWGIYYPEK